MEIFITEAGVRKINQCKSEGQEDTSALESQEEGQSKMEKPTEATGDVAYIY